MCRKKIMCFSLDENVSLLIIVCLFSTRSEVGNFQLLQISHQLSHAVASQSVAWSPWCDVDLVADRDVLILPLKPENVG